MATTKSTRDRRTPVSVARTDDFDADLSTILRTGMNQSEAVRLAVAFLAHGWQSAWDAGAVPDGEQPRNMLMRVRRHDTREPTDQQV
ncbi:hypothetical protein ACIBKZ_09705 [Streptomyces sp. NPDC050421]|uniref:hypothetical protein n=1 Tax=Streptomyces sp. NPDC050421 TaxID=3365613 RepID=UPI0037B08D96